MDNVVSAMDTRKRKKEGASRVPSLESLQVSPKRARVHAQRKFAQGSQPNSPAPTPVKETRELRDRSNSADTRNRVVSQPHSTPPPPLDIVEVPMRPTVEDFLTFLCYRGTPLLPPELEHFNTPQVLETASDSRSQSPARDDKVRSSTKKKHEGLIYDKRELSKEAVKKNLEHSTDIDDCDATPPVRVTRSSSNPASSVCSADQNSTPHKVSKRLMMKKALLLRSKAKTLRIKDRRELSICKLDKQAVDSAQGGRIATRSGRLLHKYRMSATTVMARKKAKVAKLSSMRPKQKLSRILQRLGGTVAHNEAKVPRITRSQVEPKEAAVSTKAEESPTSKTEKLSNNALEPKATSDKDACKVTRSLRVHEKQPDEKVMEKKVVRVNNKEKSSKESNSFSKPLPTPAPAPSIVGEEPAPMSLRLRKKMSAASAIAENPTATPQSPSARNSLNSGVNLDVDLQVDSKDSEMSGKTKQKTITPGSLSSSPASNDVSCSRRKSTATCEIPTSSSTKEKIKTDNDLTSSKVPKGNLSATTLSEKLALKAEPLRVSPRRMSALNVTSQNESPPDNKVLPKMKEIGPSVMESNSKEDKKDKSESSKSAELILETPPSGIKTVHSVEKEKVCLENDEEKLSTLSDTKLANPSADEALKKAHKVETKTNDSPLVEEGSEKEHIVETKAKESLLSDSVSSIKPGNSNSVPEQSSTSKLTSSSLPNAEKEVFSNTPSTPKDDLCPSNSQDNKSADAEEVVMQEKDFSDCEVTAIVPNDKLVSCSQEQPSNEPGASAEVEMKPEAKLESMEEEEENIEKEKDKENSSDDNLPTVATTKSKEIPAVESKTSLSSCSLEIDISKASNTPPQNPDDLGLSLLDHSKPAVSTRASQRKSSAVELPSSGGNKRVTGTRETRRSRDQPIANQVASDAICDDANNESGIRSRPSRHTKSAATVYLELIGCKLSKDPKQKEEYGDEDEHDDDAVSVSSIMDHKDLAKSKGKDEEKEQKDKLLSSNLENNEASDECIDVDILSDKSEHPSPNPVKYNTRKSPRQKRDPSESGMVEAEKSGVAKRRLLREEHCGVNVEEKVVPDAKVKRKIEKEDASGVDKLDLDKSLSQEIPKEQSQLQAVVAAKAGTRNLRRTRSDAEEPRKKGSRPSSRRSSLEIDALPSSFKQKQCIKGRQFQSFGENSRSDAEEMTGAVKSLKEIIRMSVKSDKTVALKGCKVDDIKAEGNETLALGSKEEMKREDEKSDYIGKDGSKVEMDKVKKSEVVESKEKENVVAEKESIAASPLFGAAIETVHEAKDKPVISGKTHRTVLQDRKTRKSVSKEEGRYLPRRKSLESLNENMQSQFNMKNNMRGKSGTSGSNVDDASNENEEKKAPRPVGRQKLVGSRRRSSNHDEAKLNEVLESVAKDFERDIDEDHYDQIEKDFVLGNKSPDKGISDKMIELSDRDDSSLSELLNFCIDDNISCNLEAFGSSGTTKSQPGNVTPQPGSSSPNPNKRSASGKKLCDVVRSLQKKQAESPSSSASPTENPTFLKDLNNWNSDKLRQVNPKCGSFHLESPSTSSAPKVMSPTDASMPENVHNPSALTTAPPPPPPPPEVITSMAPSPVPDRPSSPKVAVTKTPSVGPLPTSSPVTSHSSSSVVTVTTSCLQANAPYTAVTFSANYNVVHTSTAPLGTPAPACDIQAVHTVSKSMPLKSFQTSKDEQATVLSSIPVTVSPSTSVNILNSGFTPTAVSGLPKLTSNVTLPSHGSNTVTCAKPVELASQKSIPKQLHIAPKPSRPGTPIASSTIASPLPLPLLPQGTGKHIPKPVQIAPKPPASATPHVHHNTQMLAHQPTHIVQTQVQTPMQALPQQLQGVKAIPQAVQSVPALPHTVQNMQALSQTVQTMQAIPQPVQSMHTIPQAVQTVPQPIQTVQTLPPPMQTVTGVPVQAVITQINPTHIVTPSSPARMISHPVFATTSNQSTVTYTLAPHPISQSQLQTNVNAVARVLTPAVVGKVAAKPQSNMMAPKPPDSMLAIAPGSLGNPGSVRPIAPIPQQVQITQPQFVTVNVLPVVSTAVVGQAGLIARPQGSVVPSGHVSGNHPQVPTTSGTSENGSQVQKSLALTQHLPLSNASTTYVPSNAVVAAFPLPSPAISVSTPTNTTGTPQGTVSCGIIPIQASQPPRPILAANPVIAKSTSSKTVAISQPLQENLPVSSTEVPAPVSNVAASNASENSGSSCKGETMDKKLCSSPVLNAGVETVFKGPIPAVVRTSEINAGVETVFKGPIPAVVRTSEVNAGVETVFKGPIPAVVRTSETSKSIVRANGPVSVMNTKCPTRVPIPASVKSQIASSSVTITAIGEISQTMANNAPAYQKPVCSLAQGSTNADVGIKLPTGVSVVHHKGTGRTVTRAPVHNVVGKPSVSQAAVESNKIGNKTALQTTTTSTTTSTVDKSRRIIPPPFAKDDVFDSFIATSGPRYDREKHGNPSAKNGSLCQVKEPQSRFGREVSQTTTYLASADKTKPQEFLKNGDRMLGANDKSELDKRNVDKRKEPLLKRTLFKTKSQEERRPNNPSPVYRTKSQDDKKPSGAFSPLHESSVYAFDEPDLETSAIEVSPFSQRIKNIQSSPGTSPVKPNNSMKPTNQLPIPCKPVGRVNISPRGPVARSITPLITGKTKPPIPVTSTTMVPPTVSQPAPQIPTLPSAQPVTQSAPQPIPQAVQQPSASVKSTSCSTGTDTSSVGTVKVDGASGTDNGQSKNGSESNQTPESSEGVKKNTNSTSIAIQCDMDENIAEESVRANESGTQTEGPSKFPLPPSASPFYYLPLAMAALGEKLPAQLVQQMLAKTQGLVGAAEAGMILQQAAQLAQQHQQKLSQQGAPGPCLGTTSAVKPIKPSSVAPLISGIASNSAISNVSPLRPVSKSKPQDGSLSGSETITPTTTTTTISSTSSSSSSTSTTSTTDAGTAASSIIIPVSVSESVTVTSPSVTTTSVTALSQATTNPVVTTIAPTSKSSSLTTTVSGTDSNADPPLHIRPNRPQPTTSTPSSEEADTADTNKPKPEPKGKKRKGQDGDVVKASLEDTNPPTRRRSGRATTLAATRATESDMHEIEELRRSRRAKRAAAALAKDEGWSSSSEAPLSPQMSPDTLRGWPPPRLTSPTPSQSSEGTTSSLPSQRGRLSASRSRHQSPASNADGRFHGSSYASNSASHASSSSSDKCQDDSITSVCDNSLLVRAPSFYPSEEEFSDPLDYIEKIRPEAEQFGLCRIVPPSSFKPECRVNDDMRFTSNNQYIHKMMKRWGPNVRTLHAIKRCLARQNIELNSNPLIGCMELDLVRLYEVVEQHGGLMSVIEKDMWGKVADACRIPRSAQERLAKLDSIYCKYLLPYATLSTDERTQLLAEVDAMHSRNRGETTGKRTSSVTSDAEDEDEEESLDCIVKGKSTALSTFYRVARNISTQWQPDPSKLEVDERYWSVVVNGSHHVCVLSASIDTSEHAYGFPNNRNSPLAKHPWNLKNLCQNPNSVLRSMGTIVGVTAPTLHVGMLFSTVCWYRDPHGLPWIEYLHTGASKIWYGVAANQEEKLCAALKKIVPDFIKDSAIWLPSDTAMVPPTELVHEGVRVCRVVQNPGQFVVVFPGAFTSSICKGYLISESAFFARPQYFDRAVASFKALHDCCEPSMFSLDRLALSVVSDPRATLDALLRARDLVIDVVAKEKKMRSDLADIGLETSERLSTPDSHRKKKSRFIEDEEENMCEVCRQNLYVALVTNSQEEAVYCLEHALLFLRKNPTHLEFCKLMYTYSLSELDSAIKQMDERIHAKSGKKSPHSKKAKSREHLDSFSSTSSSNL